MQTKNWFIDRIGKRIFRDSAGCECDSCKDIMKNGFLIKDKEHAGYLYDVQGHFYVEGVKLNYRDEN